MALPTAVSLPKAFRRALPADTAARVHARVLHLATAGDRPAHPTLQWHLREYILPGLAHYQLLREAGHTLEAALAEVDQTLNRVMAPNRRQMQFLGRAPFIFPLLRLAIGPAMRQYPAPGWQLEWVENSAQAVRFNMHTCFYHETLSRLGAPELTASFCHTDDVVYGEMSPRVAWRRTQTIGRGATYCDFCFARQ